MRSPALLATALLAVACSSSSGESEREPQKQGRDAAASSAAPGKGEPVAVEVEAAEPSGPHLSLSLLGRYKDPSFGAVGLPAISDDHRRVVYSQQLQDGGRGNPNLRLVIRDVGSSRARKVIEVLGVEPRFTPEREAEVRRRIAAANAALAAGHWTPLEGPDYNRSDVGAGRFEIGQLEVRLSHHRLEIRPGGHHPVRRELRRLLGRAAAAVPGCDFRPRLEDAYAGSHVALVAIGFEGAPGCWRETQWRALKIK